MTKYQTELLIKKLKNYPEIIAVYLFGSSVFGTKSKLSDTDIGVIFDNPNQILFDSKKTLKIYEKLHDIFLPLASPGKKLDLIFLQKTPLTLQKEIILNGKVIYRQNEEKLADYKERVLVNYADIKPLLNEFYQEIYHTRLSL